MPEPQWSVFELFERAVGLPASERESFVRGSGVSASDQDRVLAMLRAEATAVGLDVARGGVELAAAMDDEDGPDPLPTIRGHYRILRRIGEGGSGAVYEAEQASPRRRVAIKALRSGVASRRAASRLRAEADILASLNHPGIAQVFEAGLDEEQQSVQAFIVMELVDGEPIHRYAERHALAARERVSLIARVCDAVEHAHRRGVIHRDLKPANILVTHDGNPKVLDFDVARLVDDSGLSDHGGVVGTLGYMSPEQADGRSADADVRSDVYALGAVLYHLLVGRPPIDLRGLSMTEAIDAVRTSRPTPAGEIEPSLRGDLEAVLRRTLAHDPADRYASVGALGEDLRRYLEGRPLVCRSQSARYVLWRHARRRWEVTTLALIVLLVLAGVFAKSVIDARRFSELAKREAEAHRVEQNAREQAEIERARGDEFNARLVAEAAAGELERARLEVRLGNGSGAEAVLWPAFFKDPASIGPRSGLRELFETHRSAWASLQPGAVRVRLIGDEVWIGHNDGSVRRLNAADGSTLGGITADEDTSPIVGVLPIVGDAVALAQGSGRVRVVSRDLSEKAPITLWSAGGPIVRAVVGAAGSTLALADASGHVRVVTSVSGQTIAGWQAADGAPTGMAFSPSGELLAVCGPRTSLTVWRISDGTVRRELSGQQGLMFAAQFGATDDDLFFVAGDQHLFRWDLTTDTPEQFGRISNLGRHVFFNAAGVMVVEFDHAWMWDPARPVRQSVGFPRDGFQTGDASDSQLATLESDGLVRLWELNPVSAERWSRPHQRWIFGIAADVRRDLVVTTDGAGVIRFARLSSDEEIGRFQIEGPVRSRCVAISPDGTLVAAGCSDGMVRVFDSSSLELIGVFSGSPAEIYGLAFDPSGTTIASGAWDRTIRLWSVPSFEQTGIVENLETVARRLVFSADGMQLFSSASNQGILVYDVDEAKIDRVIPLPTVAWAVTRSPDGRYLAAGLFDASVCLIDLATDRVLVGPGRHRLVVAGLAFSPDGKRLYSGGDDGSIREWSLETPEIGPRSTRQLNPGLGAVSVVECAGDSRVFAGTGSGWLLDWRLDGNDVAVARNIPVAAEQYAKPAGIDPSAGLRWAESVLAGESHD